MTLLEVLIGGVILAVALLGHVASTYSEFRLSRQEQVRSEVHHVVRQFMERMRADDDWAGLYARLRELQVLADEPASESVLLDDGRRAWSPVLYYPDFVLPEELDSFRVLVDVPFDPIEPSAFREDLVDERFGLPADLNGDGLTDAVSHVTDYEALPVVVVFRWEVPGEAAHEMRLATWLRGYR